MIESSFYLLYLVEHGLAGFSDFELCASTREERLKFLEKEKAWRHASFQKAVCLKAANDGDLVYLCSTTLSAGVLTTRQRVHQPVTDDIDDRVSQIELGALLDHIHHMEGSESPPCLADVPENILLASWPILTDFDVLTCMWDNPMDLLVSFHR